MNRKKVSIAVPASVVSDTPHLREKTAKVGLIGRAAAIFGIEEIIVYRDLPEVNQKAEVDLITTLLRYMDTPQYLRKRIFKLRPELRYAGILPPLRTPHHPLGKKASDLKVGEYREGITLAKTRNGILVDVGVEKPVLVPDVRLSPGERVTVKIVSINKQIVAEVVDLEEVPCYWGYKVTVWEESFGSLAKSRNFDLKIATSRYGAIFTEIKDKIAEKWEKARTVLVGFGAPAAGLYEIVSREGFNLEDVVDFVVNTIPGQQTETVRTEEALIASLAVFNCFLGL
ncbi:MAG: RNA methyltransferase [Candidatus Bathyarchaeota archaeon]|nr:RNA methyltransferase [Candidatus Bathyarchaeota archaeon]MDW8039989.1 RNA methyltransferase [Nitrososphaerota archaeon]